MMTLFFERAGIQLVFGLLMALLLVSLTLLLDHLAPQAMLPTAHAQAITNRYVAQMVQDGVVPALSNAEVDARAAAGASLSGGRLVVQGHFRHLSGILRHYALDPWDPPNPNIRPFTFNEHSKLISRPLHLGCWERRLVSSDIRKVRSKG